jgi:hypothetical protein
VSLVDGGSYMDQGVRLVKFDGEEAQRAAKALSPQIELTHFRNVTGSVVQDALNAWADLWGELRNGAVCGGTVTSKMEKGFTPSCGWPEFLEKMWVLRNHLDFVARFSRSKTAWAGPNGSGHPADAHARVS